MKNSLVCCYLTHNHAEIVRSVLEHSYKTYAERGIDIYFYDDSDDYETAKIIEEYVSNGASNLYYVDVREALGANHKLFLIILGYGQLKSYDYIWPIKDRVYFKDSFLDRLCDKIDENHDVVLCMNEWQRWDVSRPVICDYYTDPTKFYRDYGFFITNWEGTIRRRNTMLEPVDWERYSELYNIKLDGFNQLISLFVRASEMDNFSAAICRYDQVERNFAVASQSSWRNEVFKLWIDSWIDANYRLPDCYNPYKLQVIKDETNLKDIFGSVSYMMSYRDDGIFNRSIFEKYINVWPLVTDIPIESLELIADMKYEEVIRKTLNEFEDSIAEKDFLKARYLFAGNLWFKHMYDEKTYKILFEYFNEYTYDMLSAGSSKVFHGVGDINDIVYKSRT